MNGTAELSFFTHMSEERRAEFAEYLENCCDLDSAPVDLSASMDSKSIVCKVTRLPSGINEGPPAVQMFLTKIRSILERKLNHPDASVIVKGFGQSVATEPAKKHPPVTMVSSRGIFAA